MTNSLVTNAVLIQRAVSCRHLHQLISQITQYLDIWLSDQVQGELKMKLLEVEGGGARAPVPHSRRRHWQNDVVGLRVFWIKTIWIKQPNHILTAKLLGRVYVG